MPYFGRAPTGTGAANKIEGDLKVTGTISAESINSKFGLDATDGSKSNINDHVTIEDGGTDGSGTNAGDDLLLEETTSGEAEGFPGLASSTSGQLFTSAGAGSTPTFTTVSGGGSSVLARVAFSAVSAVSITAFDNANFDAYKIFWEMTPSTDGADLRYRTSTDGGSSYDSGSSDYRWRHIINDGSSPPVDFTVDGPEGRSTRGASNGGYLLSAGTGEHAVGEVTIIAPDNTGYTQIIADNLGFHTNGIVQYSKLYFARLSAADVDAIQISPSGGNITGRYVLLGIRNST